MNTSTVHFKTTRTASSRIHQLDPRNIQFGKLYSDHMFMAHYENGAWNTGEIVPYENLSFSPATTFFHYGQSIFEGVKAYRDIHGKVSVFRPYDNWKRMNRSAARMAMPDIPEEMFLEGVRSLVALDQEWVPTEEDTSLYIRPFLVAVDEFIGVKPAEKFNFYIITSPAGPYYAKPVSIYVQDKYVRAFPGGIGYTKAAGNYGATMLPTMEIRKKGYDQILWTDGMTHKYVQEIGTMNVFFVIGDTVVTPEISETILDGVTRMSVIALLRDKGVQVEERALSIDEIVEAHRNGLLKEAFGTGTAASIAPIAALTYLDIKMELPDLSTWHIANSLKKEMNDIRYGRIPDTRGWLMPV